MKHQFTRALLWRTFTVLAVLALLAANGLPVSRALAQEAIPSPWLIAFPENDAVEGWEWPEGALVTLTIDGAPGSSWTAPAAVTTWGDTRTYVRFDFFGEYDLKIGDTVTLTASEVSIPANHIVQPLAVTNIDADANTISGTMDAGTVVDVWAHGQDQAAVHPTVDEFGNWTADFDDTGFDLQEGMCGRSNTADMNGNNTAVDWCIPNPHMVVFPEWEWFDGLEWPDGAMVSISVAGKDKCATVKESWGGFFNGNFGEGCDLVIGDVVTFDDTYTQRTHTVVDLAVTDADWESNIVSGTAEIGKTVYVWPHETGQPIEVIAEDGTWQVNFTETFNLLYGDGGRSEIRDEQGNATAVDWMIPVPDDLDNFDGGLDEGWYWVNENQDRYRFSDPEGWLSIDTSSLPPGGENLLLRHAYGDFAIETHMLFEPTTNFQLAGLVIWQDESNFLQFGRAFCDIEVQCVGNGIYFDFLTNGVLVDGNFSMPVDVPNEAYLRLERRGEMVRALFSYEGITWFEIGTHWIPADFQVNGVGLTSAQDFFDPYEPAAAVFDYFELTLGHDFLPEGFHDFSEGDVSLWACNAGGWAVDPDDRSTDLNVEINLDGSSLPDWVVAGEFRQDLLDSGGCEEGTCGFVMPLEDAILDSNPHQITAYAQDIPSGDWVQLSASPKELRCRNYDIYSYDPLTGETRQITATGDRDEYNPSWSPNGKLVVHHTVFSDHNAIYITDTTTGESAPLLGAEDGGFASFSPNGRWISYDKPVDEGFNVYLVPPTGSSSPRLVREDASQPAWAPNGKRLVFRQSSDGSLRTIAVDRGKGGETIIADYGWNPEWSPDGNWIVYDDGADLWKVPVNIFGVKLGDPVRLTNLPQAEGHATWSMDSLTIVYHAGIGGDYDLWTIPAIGGEPTWLTGTPEWGDYDPAYMKNGDLVAYAGVSPDGQTARTWVAAYTFDLPDEYWTEGSHSYQFALDGSLQNELRTFEVSRNYPRFDGKVQLRPFGVRVNVGDGCADLDFAGINPNQRTQFNVGWTFDGTYAEAMAFYDSLKAQVAWDGGDLMEMQRHDVFPLTSQVDLYGYLCSFTAGPPKMDLRVNYGHDWVESFYEGGHEVTLTVIRDEEEFTQTVFTEPKEWWNFETGFQTVPEGWSPVQPDLQPGDWVIATVDNGVTARVQLGTINGSVDILSDSISGTIAAPWISDPVQVQCLDWGSGSEPPLDNVEVGGIPANGSDMYSCSWAEWDVQPGQDIGVGYFTTEGHWVANAIHGEPNLAIGNFKVEWSPSNPEEIVSLRWKNSPNLTNSAANPYCEGNLEFFGNSWVSENEGTEGFFFNSLVGWGTTGNWLQNSLAVNIGSISSGCPGSAEIPIQTDYQFFDDGLHTDFFAVTRTFEFGETPYLHDVRPYIPRLYPVSGYSEVWHPDISGTQLVTQTIEECGFGCLEPNWDGIWFAIHYPSYQTGVIVQHVPSEIPVALWLDHDAASFTMASSVLMLPPAGGFTGTVTEIEYLCFYDSESWTPSLTLPEGCQP